MNYGDKWVTIGPNDRAGFCPAAGTEAHFMKQNRTRMALADAYLRLLNDYTIDRITVKMITDAVGCSRKTFYYYFTDVYVLTQYVFELRVQHFLNTNGNFETISDARIEPLERSSGHPEYLPWLRQGRAGALHVGDERLLCPSGHHALRAEHGHRTRGSRGDHPYVYGHDVRYAHRLDQQRHGRGLFPQAGHCAHGAHAGAACQLRGAKAAAVQP